MNSVNTASAKSLRAAPSLCAPNTVSDADDATSETFLGGSYTNDDDGSGETRLTCPFPEFNTFIRSEVVTLNVYFIDNSNSNTAATQACRSDYGSIGGSCGAQESTGISATPGAVTLTPSIDEWGVTTGVAYITVAMTNGDNDVTYEGYYLQDS